MLGVTPFGRSQKETDVPVLSALRTGHAQSSVFRTATGSHGSGSHEPGGAIGAVSVMLRLTVLAAGLSAGLALPGLAQPAATGHSDAGAYLAMREAGLSRNYPAMVPFLERLIADSPDASALREQLIAAYLALGEVEKAVAAAEQQLEHESNSSSAGLVLVADAFARRDFDRVLSLLDGAGQGNLLLDGLARAWAEMGQGSVSDALATLDEIERVPGAEAFAAFCRALILALVGDAEGALAILEAPDGIGSVLDRRGSVAYAQLLGQVDRFDDALEVIAQRFSDSAAPQIDRLRSAFQAGEALPFDLVTDPAQGMAEIYALMASVLLSPDNGTDTLIYAQAALAIRPELSDARILIGQVFDDMGQHALAAEAFSAVAEDDGFALVAQLGLAQTLEAQDDLEAAIAVLQEAVSAHPESRIARQVLGDFLRRDGQHEAAIDAYTAAIEGLQQDGRAVDWRLWFSRAVAYERAGNWPPAEADFRAALAIEPDQPTVLNYLGYSLVERREKLEEALEMIERAVAGEPESGYITDSLAWALFRLGRHEEALPVMERAVSLLPQDAILNDHLGDIYWAVGRKREARFQWRRALSFGPHEDLDMDRVRRKLEIGLDRVLQEEGADPLHPGD